MREHAVAPTSATLGALPEGCVSDLVGRLRRRRRESPAAVDQPPAQSESLPLAPIDSQVVKNVIRSAKTRIPLAQARRRGGATPALLPTCHCRYCTGVGASFRRDWAGSQLGDSAAAQHRDFPQQEAVWAESAACLGWRSALACYARVEAHRLRSDGTRRRAVWAGGVPLFDASEAAFAATADAVWRRPPSPGRPPAVCDAARGGACGGAPDATSRGPRPGMEPAAGPGASEGGRPPYAAALFAECRAATAAALETHSEHVRKGTVPPPSYPHRARALAATAGGPPPDRVLTEIVETSRALRGIGSVLLGGRRKPEEERGGAPQAPPAHDGPALDVESLMAQSRALRAEARGTLL